METKEMTAAFTANVKSNTQQLADLFKAYDLAKLGYKMQEEREKECYNEVLASTPFYTAEDSKRCGIKAGERVTKEFYTFLLSKEDFNRLLNLTTPILEREGIINAEENYVTD